MNATRDVVFDNEFAIMWYYPKDKIIAHKIKKFIFGEPFHKFLLTGTEQMRKNHANKWLSDDRDSPVLRKEDTDWGMVNWFPQTVKAGWKYWAIVQPEMPAGLWGAQYLVAEAAKGGVTAKFFTDYDEALAWLQSQ